MAGSRAALVRKCVSIERGRENGMKTTYFGWAAAVCLGVAALAASGSRGFQDPPVRQEVKVKDGEPSELKLEISK